ncbi:MAG: AraC family transcriptional regulator [Muribaculaceae bacterium]|nr:AraC family transcriptional regulator [Muribaculaceae bacterium]
MKTKRPITELKLNDIPSISTKMRYFDGEIYFADNINSVQGLAKEFKVNFIVFVFCLKGAFTLKLDQQHYTLKACDGLFVENNTIVEVGDLSDDLSCKICAFNTDMGFSFISKSAFRAIMQIQQNPVIHFTDEEMTLMLKYYELLDFKMSNASLSSGKEAVTNIIKAYGNDLLASVNRHLNADESSMLRQGDKLFRKFVLMLADEAHERSVKSYADELCVSPKYLTSVCQQHGNKTASQIIAMAVTSRIKQLLLYSDLSIKEIAAELHFDNLSFFGKYVKKHLGVSPNNYRKANGYGR